MTDPLSIFEAARDAPLRPALKTAEHTWTFADLAALSRERVQSIERPAPSRPFALVGRNDLETVVTVHALLAMRIPALLLHPRLTPGEQASLLDAAARKPPIDVPDAAAILHTSGTTRAPRAAILTRHAFVASAAASEVNLGWQEHDCWLLCMPLAHVGGLSILTRCLAARRCVALAPGFGAEGFPALLRACEATLLSLVPTMLVRILDVHPGWTPPSPLRAILLGGAPASARLLERARAQSIPVLPSYGLTETCSQITTVPYAARYDCTSFGSGPPLPGARIRIRDDGHIEVSGPMVMAGYWGEPALASDGWLDTGDLGAIDENGNLHVHARRHDLIVTGGENVYPVEVENALEACAGIDAAAVFGVQDEVWGETVAAALVGDPRVASVETIAAHIRERLAPHKWPRRICFVARLPQTRAGKLDRAALAAFAPGLVALSYRKVR